MLKVQNLQKSFGPVRAVDGISFSVKRGEVVGLLGPNGAGKTTTMRLIAGYLDPDRGDISIQDIVLGRAKVAARRLVGYLPENAPLYHELEVVEFLTYCGTLQGIGADEIPGRVRKVLEQCRLHEVVGRPIGQLSRGYKQRVGLAQALIARPPLLILDEPTTGLDPHQIQEIRQLIREIGRDRTVILSTHIMQEVQAVCSRALIINRGKLAGEGTVDELTAVACQKGAGGTRLLVRIRASRQAVEPKLSQLRGLALDHWRGDGEFLLRSTNAKVDGGEVFQWAVANQWVLTELRTEETSMEEVFLKLTEGGDAS